MQSFNAVVVLGTIVTRGRTIYPLSNVAVGEAVVTSCAAILTRYNIQIGPARRHITHMYNINAQVVSKLTKNIAFKKKSRVIRIFEYW